MNIEQIEHILNDLNGEPVIVVVPFYGHVSFSVSGLLSVVSLECPMIFTVTSMPSVLWDSNDIKEIETPESSSERSHKIIIRLKGPHDYAETYQTSH